MKKLLLLFILLFSVPIFINAQTEKTIITSVNLFNKYLIKIDTNVSYNIQNTGDFIKMICAANSTVFNSTTKYYEVLTKRDLEYNIISGKLQKNVTPMADFILVGKVNSNPSAQTNTVSAQ